MAARLLTIGEVSAACRLSPKALRLYDRLVDSIRSHAVTDARAASERAELGPTLGALLGAMSSAGPGLTGVDGCPYVVYYAEVSHDSDGPVEMVRPMGDLAMAQRQSALLGDVQARVEPAHEEAFVALTMAQTRGSATMDALDVLEEFVLSKGATVTSPPRQIMIADWRTAGPDELTCHLAVTVRPVRPTPNPPS